MNNDQEMRITRQSNGYVIIYRDDDGGEQCVVYEDGAFDPLLSHENVLLAVMDYFTIYKSKHEPERIRIVREKNEPQ